MSYRFAVGQDSLPRVQEFLTENDIPLRDTPLDTVMDLAEGRVTLDQFVRVDSRRIVEGESFARHRVTFPLKTQGVRLDA